MFPGAVAVGHNRFQSNTVGGAHIDDDSFAHPRDSHDGASPGIRKGIRMSDLIH
jgi:hypothetical protein